MHAGQKPVAVELDLVFGDPHGQSAGGILFAGQGRDGDDGELGRALVGANAGSQV